MPELLSFAFMQRALIAALLVGMAAPTVGTYLVQRRLSLMGDGIGHVALAGVCLLYTSPSPRDRTRSRMPSSALKKK